MNEQLLLATLKGIQFLRGVSREHLEQIAAISQICDFDRQETVFHQGDVADSVYLVVFGKLEIDVEGPGTDRKRIVMIGPGEMIGWSSLLEHVELAASARAAETTRLVKINSAKLLSICEEEPEFGFQFMRRTTWALAKRLNATWGQLSHLRIPHFLSMTASTAETEE